MWRFRIAESNEAKTKPDLLRKYGNSLDSQLNYTEGSAIHDQRTPTKNVRLKKLTVAAVATLTQRADLRNPFNHQYRDVIRIKEQESRHTARQAADSEQGDRV